MKYCPECGAQVKDTAKFCMKCGCNIAQYEAEQAGGVILSGMRRPPRRRGAVLSGMRFPPGRRRAGNRGGASGRPGSFRSFGHRKRDRRSGRKAGGGGGGIRPEAERGAGAAAAGKIQRGGSRL